MAVTHVKKTPEAGQDYAKAAIDLYNRIDASDFSEGQKDFARTLVADITGYTPAGGRVNPFNPWQEHRDGGMEEGATTDGKEFVTYNTPTEGAPQNA